MAGPALTGVRSVIDPYEGLQKAVSDAGSIYRDYEKSKRETALYNEQMAEFDRANQQRSFLKDYDPQLGAEGRGLSQDTARFVQEEENRLIKQYSDMAAKGESVPTPEEVYQQFRENRRRLVTQEAANEAIIADMLRMDMTPEQAESQAKLRTGSYTSRAALLEAEKERAKTINEAIAARREAAGKFVDAGIKATQANNTGRGVSGDGTAKGGANDPYRNTGSIEDLTKLREYLQPIIGGWMDFDTDPAMDKLTKGYTAANQRLIDAGLNPIPIKELGMFADATLENDWYGSNTKFKSPGDVAAELLKKYSTPGYQRVLQQQLAQAGAGRTSYDIPDWAKDDMLDITTAAPRSMTEIEKELVQRVYGSYREPEAPKRQVPPQATAPAQTASPVKGQPASGELTPQQLEAVKKLQGEVTVPGGPKPGPDRMSDMRPELQEVALELNALEENRDRLSRTGPKPNRKPGAAPANMELVHANANLRRARRILEEYYSPEEIRQAQQALKGAQNDRKIASKQAAEKAERIRRLEAELSSGRPIPESMRRRLTADLQALYAN